MSVPSSFITDSSFMLRQPKSAPKKKRPWGKAVNEITIREGGVDDDLSIFLDANIHIVKEITQVFSF